MNIVKLSAQLWLFVTFWECFLYNFNSEGLFSQYFSCSPVQSLKKIIFYFTISVIHYYISEGEVILSVFNSVEAHWTLGKLWASSLLSDQLAEQYPLCPPLMCLSSLFWKSKVHNNPPCQPAEWYDPFLITFVKRPIHSLFKCLYFKESSCWCSGVYQYVVPLL